MHAVGKAKVRDEEAFEEAEGRVVVARSQMNAMWNEKLIGLVRSLDKESPQIDLFADYEMHFNDGDDDE